MNRIITGKLRLLGEFCLFGALAGIIYQLLRDGFVDFRAILMGVTIGFAYGIMELFVLSGFRKNFLKIPLILTIFLKAFIYLIVIYVVTGTIGLLYGLSEGKQIEEWYQSLVSNDQLILIIYILIFYISLSFYTHINLLLGEGALLKFLLGKYRKPSGEHRIFMFLDIKSSTTLAERLGLAQASAMRDRAVPVIYNAGGSGAEGTDGMSPYDKEVAQAMQLLNINTFKSLGVDLDV